MDNLFDSYENDKIKLNNLKSKDFIDYDMQKMLYNDVWHMQEIKGLQRIIRAVVQVICNGIEVSVCTDNSAGEFVVVEVKDSDIKRADNDTIMNNLFDYIHPYGHVLIRRNYRIDFKGIKKRLKIFVDNLKVFKNLSLSKRIFLCQRLIVVKEVIDLLDEYKIFDSRKKLLIFQEHDTVSNTVIQKAHISGLKVVSPQHSSPIYNNRDFFQVFFDAFSCDYKLLWNEFTKRQFTAAGINEEKLYVVGNTKKLKSEKNFISEAVNNKFGILLDWPKGENAVDYNIKLIELANKIAEKYACGFYVKLHPVDSVENYKGLINNTYGEVLDKTTSMEQFENMVDFSVAHNTSAIIDLIYDEKTVFVYRMEKSFPVITDDIYNFNDIEEFIDKYNKWNDNKEKYKEEYKNIISLYYTKNSKELHKKFFESLI